MSAAEDRRWREPTLWSVERHDTEHMTHTDPDEAVEMYLDGIEIGYDEWPETLKAYGYAPMRLSGLEPSPGHVLEDVLERLDEEYGGEDATLPTDAMKAAAHAFCSVIRREYKPWACDEVGEPLVVNVREWVAEHCPHWLEGGAA